jgi:hypothetical protein
MEKCVRGLNEMIYTRPNSMATKNEKIGKKKI